MESTRHRGREGKGKGKEVTGEWRVKARGGGHRGKCTPQREWEGETEQARRG